MFSAKLSRWSPIFCHLGKSRLLPFCVANKKKSVLGNILGANVLKSLDVSSASLINGASCTGISSRCTI